MGHQKAGGKFISIEGLDGSGKSTQVRLLTEYLAAAGYESKFIHFPRYNEGHYGPLITKYLRGGFGNMDEVHPQLVSLLFAGDRLDFAPQLRAWLKDGYFVIVDRYVLSNIAYQCAKTESEEAKKELKDWILDFEFNNNNIPQPDTSIFLDVPFSFTERTLQIRSRMSGAVTDIHESSFPFQRAVREEYCKLAAGNPSIHKIDCAADDSKMKPKETIHKEILLHIFGHFTN
jgi:dTMP kinase